VLSDLSDWRNWPAERDGVMEAFVAQAEELLGRAIIMKDDETRRRMMGVLSVMTVDLTTESRVRSG
jgi:hypothetical protein